jgi:hypothetical protein
VSRLFWTTFLTLLVFFPASYNPGKIVFIGVVLVAAMYAAIRGERMAIREDFAVGILAALGLGLFLALYDHLLLDFAEWRQANIFLTAPPTYLLFALLFSRRAYFPRMMDDVIFLASTLIAVNALAYLAAGLVGHTYPLEFLDLDYKRGIDERGFVAYSTNNLPMLGFTVPYMTASILYAGNRTRLRLLCLIVCTIAALASLRIAVTVDVLGGYIITQLLAIRAAGRKAPALMARYQRALAFAVASIASLLLVAIIFVGLNPRAQMIAEGIYQQKLSKKLSGEDTRYAQSRYWIEAWTERPLLGHGISSSEIIIPQMVKPGTVQNPYGYELTYLKLMSEIGLLPVAVYAILIAGLAVSLLRTSLNATDAVRRNGLAHALGMLGFLFASGTNGYLLTFGVAWTIFFPLAHQNNVTLRWREAAPAQPGTVTP